MKDQNLDFPRRPLGRKWSKRILAASLFGIFFFTLFPYWLDLSRKPAGNRSALLLGRALQFDGFLHTFLNALLFVPFGFALSTFSSRRKKSWLYPIAFSLVAGFVLSYAIEFVQIYLPTRDSAWDDVLANTAGSLLGMILGLISGGFIARKASEWESNFDRWLSLRRICFISLAYFGVWLAVSIPLQQNTHLGNWDANPILSVGNDMQGDLPWNGEFTHLQIWNKALTRGQVVPFAEEDKMGTALNSGLVADYDFAHSPPILNQAGLLPELVLRRFDGRSPETHMSPDGARDSWLVSNGSVSALSKAVGRSNQFTILVDCVPNRGSDSEGALLVVSDPAGDTDFAMEQEGAKLEIEIRNGLDSRRSILPWVVGDVFAAHKKRLIIFSYDGAKGSLYIDGKQEGSSFFFSPGAGLVRMLVRIKSSELMAYSVLYDSLIFIPIGVLLGLAVRREPRANSQLIFRLSTAVLLPSVLLEALLVWVSGRQISFEQVAITMSLTIASIAWINLDVPVSP